MEGVLTMRKKETPAGKPSASGNLAKREQRRAENRRTSLLWNAVILGTVAVTLLLIIASIINNQRPGPLAGETVIPDEGSAVVAEGAELTFLNQPPSSGTHYDQGAPWGLAEAPVTEGYYLNNLARGGVVVLYQCAAGCPELKAQFADLLKKAPKDNQFNLVKILITEYERPLAAPVVALAWGHQLALPAYDEATLLTWYRRFVNRGPTNGP